MKLNVSAFVRSLVYAGLISSGTGIIVCTYFREYTYISSHSRILAIWVFMYLFHKQRGTW